jgi:hypothetical protein
MSLSSFLDFNNQKCPVCDNQLSLYLSVWDGPLWKATCNKNYDRYEFDYIEFEGPRNPAWSTEDQIFLEGEKVYFSQYFPHKDKLKTWQLYFFFLCNTQALTNDGQPNINVYDVCYHSTSPVLQFGDSEKYQLKHINPDHHDLTHADENFSFIDTSHSGIEKVYVLNLDYAIPCTNFWYYTCTAEQKADQNFRPDIFEKWQLPFPPNRFDFSPSNRDKIISKFDSWILLS